MLNQGISFKIKSGKILQNETRINVIFDLKLEVQAGLSKTAIHVTHPSASFSKTQDSAGFYPIIISAQ